MQDDDWPDMTAMSRAIRRLESQVERPSRKPESPSRKLETMCSLLDLVMLVLNIYTYVIIASAIFSWLYAFGIINTSNQAISMIGRALYQLTEPALQPIRRFMPDLGGLDLSPVVLLLGIFLIQNLIARNLYTSLSCYSF